MRVLILFSRPRLSEKYFLSIVQRKLIKVLEKYDFKPVLDVFKPSKTEIKPD